MKWLSKQQIFILFLLAFLLGLLVAPSLKGLELKVYLLILALVLGLIFYFFSDRYLLAILLFFLGFVLGLWRYQLSLPKIEPHFLHYYNGQKVKLVGIVSQEPDLRNDKINLTVAASRIKIGEVEKEVFGYLLVQTARYPEYEYGDEVALEGYLNSPFENDQFSYRDYLLPKHIYSVIYQPQIKLLSKDKGQFVYKYLYSLKKRFTETLGRILPEPQASFMAALLYGARRGLPETLLESFNKTGTTHIIALSGFNITIIAVALGSLFNALAFSRRATFWTASLLILLFTIFAGATASVVRAAIMGLFVLLGKLIGRKRAVGVILFFTASLMAFLNPFVVRYDVGFQLSFLATLGLVYLAPYLMIVLAWLPRFLAENLALTTSAYLLTLPLIWYHFGRVTLLALPANLLILEIIPLTMFLGFVALVLGLVFFPLGQIAGWFAWLLLSYIILVTRNLSLLNWSSLEIPLLSLSWLILYYLSIFGLLIYLNQKASFSQRVKNVSLV